MNLASLEIIDSNFKIIDSKLRGDSLGPNTTAVFTQFLIFRKITLKQYQVRVWCLVKYDFLPDDASIHFHLGKKECELVSSISIYKVEVFVY